MKESMICLLLKEEYHSKVGHESIYSRPERDSPQTAQDGGSGDVR